MSGKFDDLRQELDSLGYKQKLHPECIPLVQKLLADLNTTTTNLRKYMKISQHALEERDILEFGAEPYKCDNAKLIKECNDLHIAFIHFKEQHEKIQRDLRNQISALQIRLENCNLEKSKIMSQLQQLEKEKYRKASKAGLSKDQNVGKGSKNFEISTAMASAEENNAKLNREFKDLKEKYAKISEDNNILQNQLVTRDEEISRLQSLLQGGRSFKAASKDCCYQNIDGQMGLLQDEVTRLKKEKCEFLKQVKDALAKQHEAMRRALHLAERNRQLEKEMRDIDEIALAVEAECNHTVKDNTEKVTRLQDRINESLIVIQNLERDSAKLKQDKLKLSADLDAVKLEKIHLEKQLGCESEDKKRLTDRINNFTIIENDLNLEIDRLTKLTAEQKRRIMELESQVSTDRNKSSRKDIYREELCDIQQEKEESEMADKVSQTDKRKASLKQKVEHKKSAKKVAKGKVPSRSSSPSKMGLADCAPFKEKGQKCCCESGTCMKNLKELLDKEMEYRQAQALQSIEALQQEKDYYMKEYHRALEQMRNLPTHERTDNTQSLERMQELMEYKQQLKEKEMRIKELENEIRQIKTSLLTGQELSMDSGICNNPNCKRKEREMDMKTNDLKHLDMENNTLKSKLQTLNETTIFNEERMKKAFQDMEEHIRKLEDERRDLVKVEVTQRSNISQLEEDYKMVKEQLRQTQNDLNNQKANYSQLKLLHEQTDRALSDAQAQIVRAETELVTYQSKVRDSTRDTAVYDREIAKLKSDIQIMRNQLTKLDKEKDELLNNLDEKTERIAVLEGELSSKNKSISRLEEELKELKRKLSKYVDDSSTQEHVARSKRQELAIMEQDYEQEKRLKGAALSENRRLQEDLAAVTCDCRDARNELEISRRQVEDLKRQLQHYVAEVKRTEDLISNKELERAELLDQFRCLSQEADILENTNHTLENEATQSKVQLSVALDHTSDLERRLENQESIIRSYEKQISDLTTQIASLEMQLKQQNREQEQYSTEIKQMRDLCVKLDKDKDTLKHELYSKEDYRAQVERITGKLESEKASLQKILEKERTSLEAVEKLLNEARQDVMEQRLLNQDLQNEVGRLKQKIAELQERITITSEQLDIYQGKALEYSQQNKHLRREIANERFSKAKSDDKDSSGKLESLRKTEEQRLKRAAKDIVHFSNGNEADKRSDNTLYPPYRDQSALSTKTLKSVKNYEYHGSDGIFQGTLDFTKLEDGNMETPSKPTSSALTKPVREKIDIYKGPEDGFRIIDLKRLGNDSEPPSRASSKLSTNSLVHTGKYHGSDGVLNGVIDLTRLETENIDCDEMCRKDKCPLHKKIFLKANLRNEAESNKIGYKRKAKETIKKKQISLDQDQDCWTNRTAYGGASSKMLESKKEKPQDKRLRPKETMSPNQANANHGSYEIFNEVYSPPRSPDPSNEYHGSYETFNKVANITNNQTHDKNNQIKSKCTHKKLDTKNLNYPHGSYEIFNQKAKVTGLLRNDIDRKENNQMKYKETSVNDINYPSAKVESPKSVLCRGSRNNENINNQRDNLCFSAKCLENMKQTQSREKKQSSKAYVQGTSVIADTVFISSKRKSPQQDKISDHSEGIKSSKRNTKSPTSTVLASEKPTSNGTNNQKSPEQNLKPTVSYDILWSKCKCQECWSNDSVSEPNMRGQCMSRGLTATNKCRKKNAAEKIKDRVKDGPKLLSENNNSPSAGLNDPKKIDAMPSDACVRSTMVKDVSQKLENVKKINNKTSKSTCTNCNAQAQFSQDSDDSAMFRKVFSINGVGLQCHCCISSFKTQDKN